MQSQRSNVLANLTLLFFFLAPFIVGREAFFIPAILMVGFALLIGKKINFQAGVFVASFIIFLLFGLLTGTIRQNPFYDIIKDAWYIVKVPVYFLVGYFLYQCFPQPKRILKMLLIAGVIMAVEYISKFIIDPSLFHVSRQYIRDVVGGGSVLMPVASAVMFGILFTKLRLFNNQTILIIVANIILITAMLLTQSRSFIPIFFLLLFGFVGLYRFQLALGIIAVPLFIFTLLISTPLLNAFTTKEERKEIYTHAPKIFKESLVYEHQGLRQINENWRGYEAWRTFKEIEQASPLYQALGLGLGSSVSLGMQMKLGTGDAKHIFEKITVLHNGYAYAMLKSGLVGLILYCLLILYLFRLGAYHPYFKSFDTMQYFWKVILAGLSMIQIYASMAVNGMFNSDGGGTVLLILTGLSLAVITGRQHLKEQHLSQTGEKHA